MLPGVTHSWRSASYDTAGEEAIERIGEGASGAETRSSAPTRALWAMSGRRERKEGGWGSSRAEGAGGRGAGRAATASAGAGRSTPSSSSSSPSSAAASSAASRWATRGSEAQSADSRYLALCDAVRRDLQAIARQTEQLRRDVETLDDADSATHDRVRDTQASVAASIRRAADRITKELPAYESADGVAAPEATVRREQKQTFAHELQGLVVRFQEIAPRAEAKLRAGGGARAEGGGRGGSRAGVRREDSRRTEDGEEGGMDAVYVCLSALVPEPLAGARKRG